MYRITIAFVSFIFLTAEVPELNYLNDTWVDFPLYQVLEDHQVSIEKDSGTPNP